MLPSQVIMEEINASGKKAAFHIKSKKPLSTEGKKFSPIQMQSTLSKFWKFEVDYNDHFETPLIAYKDIDLILITIAKSVGKSKDDLIIYDPYYCHGQMVNHLSSLGYTKIINSNTDFYADIKHKKIPGMKLYYYFINININDR